MAAIVEWAPFGLREGATEEQLLTASEQLQRDFLSKQKGFLHRRLVRGEDGGFVDIVLWESAEAANLAMEQAGSSAVCATYFSLMRPEEAEACAGVSHFTTLAEFGRGGAP